MNAKQLHHEDGSPAGIWHCSSCGTLYGRGPNGQDVANTCCICTLCGDPIENPKEDGNSRTQHSECRWRARQQRYEDKLAVAQPVEWDDWVSDGENFYSSPEEAYENDVESEYLFCCKPFKLRKYEVGHLIETWVDGHYEDAADDLVEVDKLQEALDAFWEANQHVMSWDVDYEKKVKVQP